MNKTRQVSSFSPPTKVLALCALVERLLLFNPLIKPSRLQARFSSIRFRKSPKAPGALVVFVFDAFDSYKGAFKGLCDGLFPRWNFHEICKQQ